MTQNYECHLVEKKASPLDFQQFNHFKFMRTYAGSRGKGKSFYRKRVLQIFLLISGGHICVPNLYTRMASTYLESDFKMCNTEDDGCTVEKFLEN